MIYKKSNLLILIAIAFVLLSFCAFKATSGKYGNNESEETITKVDSFQVLIGSVCDFRIAKEKAESAWKSKKTYSNKTTEILSQLEKLREECAELKIDSVALMLNKSIELIKKQNAVAQRDLNVLDKEFQKSKDSLEQGINKLRSYAFKKEGSLSFNYCNVKYNVYISDLDSEKVRIHLFNKEKKNYYSLGAVKEFLKSQKVEPLMITNAGMYTPSNEPEGLYDQGDMLVTYPLDTEKRKTDENFYLMPNGVFYIDTNNTAHIETTDDFIKLSGTGKIHLKLATQSGPMLLTNRKMHNKFVQGSANAKIRSGVGIISDKKIVFAITLSGSNFYDFASFFNEVFNCKDALFLDGAISLMYLKDLSPNTTGGNFGPIISVSKK